MPGVAEPFTRAQLEAAHRSLTSTVEKCEKVQPKLKPGSSQHTLLVRRIEALRLALALIRRELDAGAGQP